MNIQNLLKGLGLSIASLVAGFIAIGVPFRIFTNLSGDGLRIFFIIEMATYIVAGAIFLLVSEKKKQKKIRQEQRLIRRQKKINDVIENWHNIAA